MKKIKFILVFAIFLISNSQAGIYWDIENGINEFKKNNYTNAKEFFIQYSNNNPNDKDGFWWLGRTYLRLNDKETANINFEKAYNIFIKEKDINKITFSTEESADIDEYLKIAKTCFDENNLKEADYYADLILKADSKSANAYFIKAKIAQTNQNYDLARDYLRKAIIYNKSILKTNLAKLLNVITAPELTEDEYENFIYEAYFSGDIQKAIYYLKEYISSGKEKGKENAEAYNFLAELYYLDGSIDLAKEMLSEAKKIDKKNIKIYLLEAEIYEENKEKLLLQAYKLNPNNQDVLLALGNYYIKKEDYENAYNYFSSLANINDGLYEGYIGYILCLIKKGENQKALKYIRKASFVNKKQSESDILLAEICLSDFKYKEALEYIQEAIKKDKNPIYYLKKAQIEHALKNYDVSIKDLSEAKKYSDLSENKLFQELTMMNYLKKEDYKNLQQYLTSEGQNLDKNSLIYKYNLYKLYKYNGDKNKAKLQYLKIFTHKPSSIADCIKLSEILLFEKGENEALKFLDNCLKQNKNAEFELNHQKEKIKFIQNIK